MGRFTRTPGTLTTLAAVLGLWLIVMMTVSASAGPRQTSASNPRPPEPAAAAPATQAAGFVGDDTCLTCHEDQAKGYHASPHARAKNPRTPAAAQGCESCHGPGQAHAEGGGDKTKIRNPKTLSPREASETCLTCHTRGTHDNFEGEMHYARNVSCATCHSVHSPKSEKAQLKTVTAVETCQTCHKQQAMKVKNRAHAGALKARWTAPPATRRTDRTTCAC